MSDRFLSEAELELITLRGNCHLLQVKLEAADAELLTLRATCHRLQAEQDAFKATLQQQIADEFNRGERTRCSTCEYPFRNGQRGSYGSYCSYCQAELLSMNVEQYRSQCEKSDASREALEADLSTLRQQQAETQQERDELPLLYDGRTLEAVLDDWVDRLRIASESEYRAIADEIGTVAGRLWIYTELLIPAELTIELAAAEAALATLQASLRSLLDHNGGPIKSEYAESLGEESADDYVMVRMEDFQQLAALVPLPPQEETNG